MKFVTRLLLYITTLALTLCNTAIMSAQTLMLVPDEIVHNNISPKYEIVTTANYWLLSQNPTSIGINKMPDIGSFEFAGKMLDGNLHRVMESNSIYSWGFGANSYQALKNINLWGDFTFYQNYHHGRNWSDFFNPYNGNPYQAGSPLDGKYIEQTFDFKIKASSNLLFNRMWFGLGFDYGIGDLSRTQDPRSRTQFIDLTISPGLAVSLGKHNTIGATFQYKYRKEKINEYISKAANGKEYLIYLQEGLGVFKSVYSSYFDRRVKGHYLGGELQYDLKFNKFSLFATGLVTSRTDIMEDKFRECPGDYANLVYKVSLNAEFKDARNLHLLKAKVTGEQGSSNKIEQKLVTVTKPSGVTSSHFETVFTAKAYTDFSVQADLNYKYYRLKKDRYSWFAGIDASFLNIDHKYVFYIPQSTLNVNSMSVDGQAGGVLFAKRRHKITASCLAGYIFNINGSQSISSELKDPTIKDNVIDPDFEFLCKNAVNVGANIRYIFPVSKRFDGYVSIDANSLISPVDKDYRLTAGLSIGFLRRK